MILLINLKTKKFLNTAEFTLFILPALILVVITTDLPFLMNIYYSFQKWNGLSKVIKFIGAGNFIELFTDDPSFWHSFAFTFKYLFFYAVFSNVTALTIAVLLSNSFAARGFVRSSIYLPYIISLIAVSLIWQFIFGTGFEALYRLTGLELFRLSWLGDGRLVFYSVLVTTLWQTIGFYMVIYIAGLTTIPTDIIEASEIDGYVGLKRFFKIKLPLIMPSLTVCVFYSITYAFKLFDIILVMTKGGPGEATATIAFNIYTEAFVNSRYGYGTAKSLVLFVVVLIVTVVQVRFFKEREVEA